MDNNFVYINKSNNSNKFYFAEKVAYISVLFMTSIGMLITMFFSWLNVASYDGDVEKKMSLASLFNEIVEKPKKFANSFSEDAIAAVISIFLIFIVVLFIVSIVLIIAFLIRLGTSIRNPKGVILGKIAMSFSLFLLLFTLLYKIALNINANENGGYYDGHYEVATAPYIFLTLCIVTIVILKKLSKLIKVNNEQ